MTAKSHVTTSFAVGAMTPLMYDRAIDNGKDGTKKWDVDKIAQGQALEGVNKQMKTEGYFEGITKVPNKQIG